MIFVLVFWVFLQNTTCYFFPRLDGLFRYIFVQVIRFLFGFVIYIFISLFLPGLVGFAYRYF
jgi:hypothetical protein